MRRVVVIAPWGSPFAWSKALYRIDLRVFDLGSDVVDVLACNSTVAFAASLLSSGFLDLKIIVVVPDTILPPSKNEEGASFRSRIKNFLSDAWMRFISESQCSGCKSFSWDRLIFEVLPVPGIGGYYNFRFNGSVEHVFNALFLKLVEEIEKMDKDDIIILDISHGINYLTVISLYATIAAILSKNPILEQNLKIVNTEAFPPDIHKEFCLKADRREKQVALPSLATLNFSSLQKIIQFLRAINSLIKLDERPLMRMLPEFSAMDNSIIYSNLVNVINLIKAIRLGLVAMILPGTNISFNIEKTAAGLDNLINDLRNSIPGDFLPIIREKEVYYDPTNIYASTYIVFLKIKEKLENCTDLADLDSFLEFLRHLYGSNGLENVYLVVEKEFNKLKEIIQRFRTPLRIGIKTDTLLQMMGLKIRKIDCHNAEGLRHFLAHAGFIYEFMSKIKFDKRLEIRFDIRCLKPCLRKLNFIINDI